MIGPGVLRIKGDMGMSSAVALEISREVGRDRIKPGGKLALSLKAFPILIDSDEGFFGQVSSLRFVLQNPQQVMKEPFSVARHEVIQSGVVAGCQSRHVAPILRLGRRIYHARSLVPAAVCCMQVMVPV